MNAALQDEAGGPVPFALPELTPHSFASLPDAFCAALSAVSTLLKVVEQLYAICRSQQQRLEESSLLSAPDSPAACKVPSEQKQQERSSCAVSVASRHSSPVDKDNGEALCRVEAVLQTARLLICNADQYAHLLLSAKQVASPALPTTLENDTRNTPYAATHVEEKELCHADPREHLRSTQTAASGEFPRTRNTSSKTRSQCGTARDEGGNIEDAAGGVDPEMSHKELRQGRSKCGSTLGKDYELSVCKALLMLQQLDLHKENVSSEEEGFLTLERLPTRQQQTTCDTQNYMYSVLQREAFYDNIQREVEKCQAPLVAHEQQSPREYGLRHGRRRQRLHTRFPPSLQSVLAGGPFIRISKAVILELLLRIKVLQEAQRTLRADVIMLRHQHFLGGQTLWLTLQKILTTHGLEKRALLCRLQKLAALLQNK